MKRIAAETAESDLQLVSLSVDPEFDTPAVLADYAARHGIVSPRWRFLTGDPGAVREVVEDGFKIAMERRGTTEGGAPDIVHGSHFVLLDSEAQIRGYYDSTVPERLQDLLRDARGLTD